MKKFANLITWISMTLVLSPAVGCGQLEARGLSRSLKKASNVTNVVCKSALLFDAIGVSVPCVEHCEKILPTLNSDDMKVVISIVECAELYKPPSTEFKECVTETDWEPIRDRILELAKE